MSTVGMSSVSSSCGSSEGRPPRRRWLRYSLRGLLALMLLAAIGAWWLKTKVDAARREEQAIAALMEVGGVTVHCQQDESGGFDNANKPEDSWLRSLFGDAFVDEPVSIHFGPRFHCTRRNLEWIRDLPTLETVTFWGPCDVREPGAVAVIGELPNLKDFTTDEFYAINEEIQAWGKLKDLEYLQFRARGITAESLDQLTEDLPNLVELRIDGSSFGPGPFRGFSRLKSLEKLSLAGCQFADNDFTGLEIPAIKMLSFSGSNITEEDLARLQRAMPHCQVMGPAVGQTDSSPSN